MHYSYWTSQVKDRLLIDDGSGRWMLYRVTINYEICRGCGDCVKACSMSVLELIDDTPYPTDLESCHGCEDCVKSCEFGAIKVEYVGKKK